MLCDVAWLDRLPMPPAAATPQVITDTSEDHVGARIVVTSAHPPQAWAPVLHAPETSDDWLPGSLGVSRVERLDAAKLYYSLEMPVLGGMFHFRRQTVVNVEWLMDGARLRTCWTAVDPGPWSSRVGPWDTGAAWQLGTMGGWDVEALPGGGSRVSYHAWAPDKTFVPGLQEWAMSRTLPEMLAAYEAHVAATRR